MSINLMTKTEFKTRWESNEDGGGINYEHIAECAKAWGITQTPKIGRMDVVRYQVLKAANTNDAEKYRPYQEQNDDDSC